MDITAGPSGSIDLIDCIDLPIVVVDCEQIVVTFNIAAEKLFSAEALREGQPLREIIDPHNAVNLEALCDHVIAGGAPVPLQLQDRAGSWFSVRVGPYKTTGNQIAGAVLAFTNVTAFRASLEQAIHEREYTKAVINAVIDPLVVVDPELKVQAANQAFYRVFNVSRDATQNVPLYEIGSSGWDVTSLRVLLELTGTERESDESIEIEHVFVDSGLRTLMLKANRLTQVRDAKPLTVISLQDITHRKEADKALRNSEDELRQKAQEVTRQREELYSMLMQSPLPIAVFRGPELVCEFANGLALELTGRSDMVGRSVISGLPEIKGSGIDHHLASVLSNGKPIVLLNQPVKLPRKGQIQDTYWNYSLTPLRDFTDDVDCVMVVGVEVTDEVLARTEMEAAMALKDQFLSLVSHELRTPLSTIYGSSRLLESRFDMIPEDDRRRLLADVVSESGRLERIIQNLLLMTRLDAKGLVVEPLSIAAIIERLVKIFPARHEGRAVDVEMPAGLPFVTGNETYIELVLENLLSNAAKYSSADTPIDVVVTCTAEVRVSVLDRGIGIGWDAVPRLFEPFYRTPEAEKWASGVGVGLAVCKRVVEAQGGKIWAKPRSGGGSEFGFSLQQSPLLGT